MRAARRPGTTFATTAAVLLVAGVLIVVFLVQLSSSGSVKSQLGATTFLAGYARTLAPLVDQQGPIGLPPLLGKTRPIYLQHLGADEKKGWVAIQALVPGEAERCVLHWEQADHRFRDPCTSATYPPDGTGLPRYPATVLPSDRVNVDLRTPLAP